jgi:hypothetical protein
MESCEFTLPDLAAGEAVRIRVEAESVETAKLVELWIRTAAASALERVQGLLASEGAEPAERPSDGTQLFRGEVALTVRGTAAVRVRAASVEDARARLVSGDGVQVDWGEWIEASEHEMEPVGDVEEVAA